MITVLAFSLLLNTVFLILVPRPMLTSTVIDTSGTLYAGSRLTLSCEITLDQALMEAGVVNDVTVTSRWFDSHGHELMPTRDCMSARVCASEATRVTPTFYTSTVVFDTLRISDNGIYNCTATVNLPDIEFIMDGWESHVRTVRVQCKLHCIIAAKH